jgi:RNA polymerase sigma-70 factor (ECF subfamily)
MVYRCCYSFLFNREDAEDLSQEVFITVYHSLDSFKHKSTISTWIMRIAINKSLNYLRTQKKHEPESNIKEIGSSFDFEDSDNTLIIKKKILKKLIDELPKNQRVAFVMNKYNGLTAKEIAEINKKSVNSVELLIHRAYKSINKKAIEMYNKQKKLAHE